jgi:hypothetical protein
MVRLSNHERRTLYTYNGLLTLIFSLPSARAAAAIGGHGRCRLLQNVPKCKSWNEVEGE